MMSSRCGACCTKCWARSPQVCLIVAVSSLSRSDLFFLLDAARTLEHAWQRLLRIFSLRLDSARGFPLAPSRNKTYHQFARDIRTWDDGAISKPGKHETVLRFNQPHTSVRDFRSNLHAAVPPPQQQQPDVPLLATESVVQQAQQAQQATEQRTATASATRPSAGSAQTVGSKRARKPSMANDDDEAPILCAASFDSKAQTFESLSDWLDSLARLDSRSNRDRCLACLFTVVLTELSFLQIPLCVRLQSSSIVHERGQRAQGIVQESSDCTEVAPDCSSACQVRFGAP